MKGAVTASSQEASDSGAAILTAGGNAIDAAVSAALVTCVVDPSNTGIGGYGGYLIIQRSDEKARCVQFPLCAPSSLSPDDLSRTCPESGPGCSSVPNVVGGLACALREFGTLSWQEVSAPAIEFARRGVSVNAPTARAFALNHDRPFIAECFDFDSVGSERDVFRQPALAGTLERMAEEGPEWFYEGPLAETAQSAWQEAGVDIPLEDWRRQHETVEVVDAPVLEIRDTQIHAAPLGLSGSAVLFAMLVAAARISEIRPLCCAQSLADLASAMVSIWQYRFSVSGGTDFAEVDIHKWIDSALTHPATGVAQASPSHTAHLNAIDSEGTIVGITFTHGPTQFGGRWALPGTGVIMNGGMHYFAPPTVIRRRGRWFGMSNMTPTIAVTGDGARIAVGCPGARRVPSNIAIALARHLFGDQDLSSAVAGGRLHAEDMQLVTAETDRLETGTVDALRSRFAHVEPESGDNYFGPLTAIRRDAAGNLETAVDDRKFRGFATLV